jgi:hypothetical protein
MRAGPHHHRDRAAVTFLSRAALQGPYTFVIVSLLLGLGSITTALPAIFQSQYSRGQRRYLPRFRGEAFGNILPLGTSEANPLRKDSNA